MGRWMIAALAPLAWLAACGQPHPGKTETPAAQSAEATTPAVEAAAAPAAPAPWFLCDAIDQPAVLVAYRDGDAGAARVTLYSKTGAAPVEANLRLTSAEGAAGSTFRNWTRAGRDAGYVRSFNPGTGVERDVIYTEPVTSVRLDVQDYACRWLARTRLAGITARRSVFITQDEDGDLIYQTFDFANAAHAQQVELDNAQRSTVFSVEVRGGTETSGGFAFETDGYRYEIAAPRGGEGVLRVSRNGRELLREPFVAFVTGPE